MPSSHVDLYPHHSGWSLTPWIRNFAFTGLNASWWFVLLVLGIVAGCKHLPSAFQDACDNVSVIFAEDPVLYSYTYHSLQ